ncbi:MAG TPA: hypothetical protein VF669_07385 [Tepidisphaeraceae bacterium]|jgi:hypothetical protein
MTRDTIFFERVAMEKTPGSNDPSMNPDRLPKRGVHGHTQLQLELAPLKVLPAALLSEPQRRSKTSLYATSI